MEIFNATSLFQSFQSRATPKMPKIKPKKYKYSQFKDTQKMIDLNNFGKKCKNCKKELTKEESKKPIGLCNKCEII